VLANWDLRFPGCEPVAHRLKFLFPNRWVRLHSLPRSKRYAEGEEEFAILLARHNRVLGELLGEGRSVILLTTGYSDTPSPSFCGLRW
jgi:hypothetical protein